MKLFARSKGAGRRRFKRAEGGMNAIVSPFCNIFGMIGSGAMVWTGSSFLNDFFDGVGI